MNNRIFDCTSAAISELTDLVAFTAGMTAERALTEVTKWVSFGGSCPGTLPGTLLTVPATAASGAAGDRCRYSACD